MGGCFSVKQLASDGQTDENNNLILYTPLYDLKKKLMETLQIPDEHFYSTFLNYRFQNYLRKSKEVRDKIKRARRL
jgi:hypothetical protein